MGNENDWKELEKWDKEQEGKRIAKFGMDTNKIDLDKQARKMRVVSVFTTGTYNFIKYLLIIICILGFGGGLLYAYFQFDSMKPIVYIKDAKSSIEKQFNIKIKQVSEEIYENGNEKYVFALKKNKDIKFTIRINNGISNDFLDSSHKYWFEKWNSEYKNSFKIEEKVFNDILDYSTYLEIDEYKDIESSMEKIKTFVEFCKKDFYPMWKIYLKKGEMRFYAYTQLWMTHEEAVSQIKRDYLKYLKENNIEEDIPEDEINKYLDVNK